MPEASSARGFGEADSPKIVRPADLDEVDRKILGLLHADARITNSALAEQLG
ncbi:MAG TPA: AsnC family transcriptional regulator, partial [Mycobacterium sp.]|nr:AsnC family transcriptional regulator [Mycobacterium sp.]